MQRPSKPISRDDEKRRRYLARIVASWPAIDRERWEASCAAADPFDDPGYGTKLRLTSLLKIAKGYSSWLNFLCEINELDGAAPPEARISHACSAGYFRALKARGNRPFTIVSRFSELNLALKILAPDADRSCVLRPHGASVRTRLILTKRQLIVPDARLVYAEGIRLMDTATEGSNQKARSLQFRDGLLFAILASRARRLGTTTQTTATFTLRQHNGRYWLDYLPEQIKTHVSDNVLLPRRLSPYIEQYMAETRPSLLGTKSYDALWIGTNGKPLAERGIEQIVRRRSSLLGVSFGPHRLRYAIGTTAPLINRAQPGLARAVLNISAQTAAEHYNRANATIAAELFHNAMLDAVMKARERLRLNRR